MFLSACRRVAVPVLMLVTMLSALPACAQWPCQLPARTNLGKVGSSADATGTPTGGLLLMGGGTDVDAAVRWMIGHAGGGDALVIRASGTNAYNSYMYDMGGLNSVQTLLIDSRRKANDACVVETIKHAEMLFIAGGNQQDYVNDWKGQGAGNAINYLINTKHAVVGGTSAGMAILGQYYHPGGAPDDSSVLQNPTSVAIGTGFVNAPQLANLVTDTHFEQRGRQPRLVSFMASTLYNFGVNWQSVRGIACDEVSAYAIEPDGNGRIFGSNNCFFARATGAPEVLKPSTPLTWNVGTKALSVYVVKGTETGSNTFNINSFTGTGSTAHNWWVNQGVLTMQ